MASASSASSDDADKDMMRILVFTDNHCGYAEGDRVRGSDSFLAFEEALRFGKEMGCDFAINSGDIFHDNQPSRLANHRVLTALRTFCMGDRPTEFELLGDQSRHFGIGTNFRRANYLDPHYNIDMPLFCIHGNHDDPVMDAAGSSMGALSLLEAANMVNYFGRRHGADDVRLEPLLFRKGSVRLALYGLGNMRDERLNSLFRDGKVIFMDPAGDEVWVKVLLIHQNRVVRGAGRKNSIDERHLPANLHLVIWGHEHDCRIGLERITGRDTVISQPGSSVATSLSEGEAITKHIGILNIRRGAFELVPHRLRCIRPFKFKMIVLADEPEVREALEDDGMHDSATDTQTLSTSRAVQAALQRHAHALIAEAAAELDAIELEEDKPPMSMRLPLIRLRVDHTGFPVLANKAFGADFTGRVANPEEMLQFFKARAKAEKKDQSGATTEAEALIPLAPPDEEGETKTVITSLLRDSLKSMGERMAALTDLRLIKALEQYVWQEKSKAFGDTLTKRLSGLQKELNKLAAASSAPGEIGKGDALDRLIGDNTAADQLSVAKRVKARLDARAAKAVPPESAEHTEAAAHASSSSSSSSSAAAAAAAAAAVEAAVPAAARRRDRSRGVSRSMSTRGPAQSDGEDDDDDASFGAPDSDDDGNDDHGFVDDASAISQTSKRQSKVSASTGSSKPRRKTQTKLQAAAPTKRSRPASKSTSSKSSSSRRQAAPSSKRRLRRTPEGDDSDDDDD